MGDCYAQTQINLIKGTKIYKKKKHHKTYFYYGKLTISETKDFFNKNIAAM